MRETFLDLFQTLKFFFAGQLTGRELLEMFANLRGVPYSALDDSVNEVIRMFNLEDHADKECKSYSGG